MDKLTEGLQAMGLPTKDSQVDQLRRYQAEIELWNPRYGLVQAQGDEFVVKHLLDSLAALPILDELDVSALADVGSGAGLPGIPLAILSPDRSFTLIERSGRRAGFLRNAALALKLKNLHVIEAPVEQVRSRFPALTFRAFTTLDGPLLDALSSVTESAGSLVAYKGKRKKIDEELSLISHKVAEFRIVPVSIPFLDEERHLVVLKTFD